MRNKNIALMISSILVLVIVIGMGSARVDFLNSTSGVVITSVSETVGQGQSITISFKAEESGYGTLTGITFGDGYYGTALPVVFDDVSFTNSFNSANTVTGAITTLPVGTTSGVMSLTINIPPNQALGNYEGLLTLTGTYATSNDYDLTIYIQVTDITSPVITLTGDNPQYIRLGDAYTELGATATDNVDGTITPSIVIVSSAVNTAVAGNYSVTYNVDDSAGNSATQLTRTVIVTNMFCASTTNSTDLDLNVDIKNNGEGKDNEWLSLDNIEVEVKFDNNKDSDGDDLYDLEDAVFELGLYKAGSSKNLAGDLIWISQDNEEFEFGDVDEGKDAEHIFEFKIDPNEFDEGNYILMVKAYSDGNECISFSDDLNSKYYATIEIQKESDKDKMVIIDTSTFPTTATASCGQEVTFTADVWNIGDTDFVDQIKVTLLNTALGINEFAIATGDLDAGEKTQVIFTFDVPEGAEEKTHNLALTTYYGYDADDEEYDKTSDTNFIFPLKVEGNCAVAKATLTAILESGGKAGEPLVVKTTVTNTGTESTTYTFSVADYSDWASSATLNNTLTLAPGESKEITITLAVKDDVSGDKTFNLETYSNGKLVSTQPVQASIEEGKTRFNLKDNESMVAILIALISAIIIAIIIVLIVRASRR